MHITHWAEDRDGNPDIGYYSPKIIRCVVEGHVEHVKKYIDAGRGAQLIHNYDVARVMRALGAEEYKCWYDDYEAGGGWTTLTHLAVRYDQIEVLRLFVQAGQTVDCVAWNQTAMCYTPLSEAANFGRLNAVQMLLGAGARADYAIALCRGVTVSSDLLRRSLDPRRQGRPGPSRSTFCWTARRTIFELLLKHGADTSFEQPCAHTPTMEMAVRFNQLDLTHKLLQRGVTCEGMLKAFVCNPAPDVNLLHLLVINGAADVEDALDPVHIDAVGMEERFDKRHKIPLWPPAVGESRHRAMELILQHFVDFAKTPQASEMIVRAAHIQDIAVMEVLQASGISINYVGLWGYAPIHMASFRPTMDVLEWLLTHGADISNQALRSEHFGDCHVGDTALHVACQSREPDIVERLICAGADVFATNGYGETPLLSFCRKVCVGGSSLSDESLSRVLQSLLRAGSDIDALRSDGMGALHLLPNRLDGEDGPMCSASIVETLIDYGIDPLIRDRNGKLAVQHAIEQGQRGSCPLRIALEKCTTDYPLVMELMSLTN